MEDCKHENKIIDHWCHFSLSLSNSNQIHFKLNLIHFFFVFYIIVIESFTFRSLEDTQWPTCSGNSAGHRDSGKKEQLVPEVLSLSPEFDLDLLLGSRGQGLDRPLGGFCSCCVSLNLVEETGEEGHLCLE
jgi:hypothetical protein